MCWAVLMFIVVLNAWGITVFEMYLGHYVVKRLFLLNLSPWSPFITLFLWSLMSWIPNSLFTIEFENITYLQLDTVLKHAVFWSKFQKKKLVNIKFLTYLCPSWDFSNWIYAVWFLWSCNHCICIVLWPTFLSCWYFI